MVLTVEPGIYIRDGADGVDPKWWNIGVRIEDDVLVTGDGHRVLSTSPREIDEIEALMVGAGPPEVIP
jgi:Xaa-Pro aminopeptidase